MHDRNARADSVTAADPGLSALVMLLRLHGIGADPEQIAFVADQNKSLSQKRKTYSIDIGYAFHSNAACPELWSGQQPLLTHRHGVAQIK